MVRFGVVGAGWFASRRHLPELVAHPEVELVALCRRSPEPLARIAEHFGVARSYTRLDDMLSDAALDAVLICTPHDLHHANAVACLEAGCQVLLEKPMAICAADAADLVRRADQAGLLLEVAYNPPYWSHCCWLRERLEQGELGELEALDLRWTGDVRALYGRAELPDNLPGVVAPSLFRGDVRAMGGGLLIDGGSHLVCESMWVTGHEWTSVAATMDAVPGDLRHTVQFMYDNCGLGSIVGIGDSARPGRQSLAVYYGTRATAYASGAPATVRWVTPDGAERVYTDDDFPVAPQPVVSFVETILGRGPQRSPGSECVRYVRAVEAAYEAAATGRRVTL